MNGSSSTIMWTKLFLICLIGQGIAADVIRPRGVSLARKFFYDPSKDFTCIDGSLTIPFTQVNDDYCDCADGSDEPGTSACANGKFTCPNVGYFEKELDSSKVNDGLCDCCDGSDEFGSSAQCANSCFELGELAREEYRKQQEVLKAGHDLREQYKEQARQKRDEIARKLAELAPQMTQLKEERQQKSEAKQAAEDNEKQALEQHAAQAEQKRQASQKQEEVQRARDMERTNAVEAFRVLDSNQDGVLTYQELIASGLFDQNEDGVITDEEARFFLGHKDQMDLEEFVTLGWVLSKPFFQKHQHAEEQVNQPDNTQAHDIPEPHSTETYPTEPEHQNDHFEKEEHDPELFDNVDAHKNEYEEIEDEEEFKEDDSYKHEEPASHSDNVEYDEQTKQIVEQAKQARDEFNQIESKYFQVENQIRELESSLAHDYGKEDEFLALQGHCFDYNDREYTYRLCPYDRAAQIPKNGGGEINLGRWGRWTGPEEDKYSSFRLESGQICWNGPPRITDVILSCGQDNVIVAVTEPSRCEYQFVMQTPARCILPKTEEQHQHTEL